VEDAREGVAPELVGGAAREPRVERPVRDDEEVPQDEQREDHDQHGAEPRQRSERRERRREPRAEPPADRRRRARVVEAAEERDEETEAHALGERRRRAERDQRHDAPCVPSHERCQCLDDCPLGRHLEPQRRYRPAIAAS
jgi:hypothetical protein